MSGPLLAVLATASPDDLGPLGDLWFWVAFSLITTFVIAPLAFTIGEHVGRASGMASRRHPVTPTHVTVIRAPANATEARIVLAVANTDNPTAGPVHDQDAEATP